MLKTTLLSLYLLGITSATPSTFASDNPFSSESDADSTGKVKKCRLCFPDNPDKSCCFIFLTESSYIFATNRKHKDDFPPGELLTIDLGLLRRVTSKDAFGATVSMLSTGEYSRFGIRSRYRRWLDDELSLDLTAGIVLSARESQNMNIGSGIIASASLGIRDLISFDLLLIHAKYSTQEEIFHGTDPPRLTAVSFSETNIYLGMSGRSYMAAAVTGLWLAMALAGAASFNGL